ncbi:hypothetical protein NBRC116592_04740 [Colwellia sp. KU-HH00111]|uniref:hypothetical protein n=1 Tax=Colwellia sp. KU-HH00111 TaxID=3127652 RepID=UPI003108A326
MITISQKQDGLLSSKIINNFVEKTMVLLRHTAKEWCLSKDDDELNQFINDMVTFAHSMFVFDEENIELLILYKIEFNFDIPLSEYRHMMLCRSYFDEHYRINQFHQTLTAKAHLVKITLDTDLASIR